MSKLEMVKNLADSRNRTLMDLAQQIEALQVILQSSLAVMQATQSDVQAIPAKFQELMELQLATMGEVMDEITRILPPMVEAKLTPLVEAIAQANKAATEMQAHSESVAVTVAALAKQNQGLNDLSVQMRTSAAGILNKMEADKSTTLDEMKALVQTMQQAEKSLIANRPAWWERPAQMLLCAVIAVIGVLALNKQVPQSAEQVNSEILAQLWNKASPAERTLLMQIGARPAK